MELGLLGDHREIVDIRIRMLGPLAIERRDRPLELPASRKTCGLLAYLALTGRPAQRGRLCELLWDEAANDPRGELRWCLSKLRGLFGDPGGKIVVTAGDAVALQLDGWFVDAIEVASAMESGVERLSVEQLQALSELYRGELVEGLAIERCPEFNLWLTGQQSRYAAFRATLLQRLVEGLPADSTEGLAAVEKWVVVAPFDPKAQIELLRRLALRGRIDACKRQLAAAARLYESEALDFEPVRKGWREVSDAPAAAPSTVIAVSSAAPAVGTGADNGSRAARRPSLAVMPFHALPDRREGSGETADGLTHDIITRLAKLRNFFVIAEGSVFALGGRRIGPEEAGRRLNVDYVASGSVRRRLGRLSVSVELIETATARILWTEDFDCKQDDVFSVIDDIGNRIVALIASEIETVERNRAVLRPPDSLDAWQAYHRGLWHMYRFTQRENETARQFFEMAVRLDPTFSRAHAGLSFTHWQSAFQHWGDREQQTIHALETAGRGLIVDEHDPAVHWAMGRALWLSGRHDDAIGELQHTVDLSPNFALGHYALAFVHSQSGDPLAAIKAADHSRLLSPFDPLLFGMLGSKAMAHVRLEQFDEAAAWSARAAMQPNAHVLILAIAAFCHALTGQIEQARAYASAIRKVRPLFTVDDYLNAFQFSADAALLFRKAAETIGLA
ncbi:transcriptional regulator [Bradyrhizobium ontarionense]|uniref:Transcriptional regulator n=1 Tax=Bradyrhizobium ontarionense TaxID=2898149 RepID=A0ABY3RMP5_9BRAD|nr:transcriptional regulator [Bradyrhizobium sp. A19]UFZ07998.1 transcriptional regulator [Bradyrhizobium sp. A19]